MNLDEVRQKDRKTKEPYFHKIMFSIIVVIASQNSDYQPRGDQSNDSEDRGQGGQGNPSHLDQDDDDKDVDDCDNDGGGDDNGQDIPSHLFHAVCAAAAHGNSSKCQRVDHLRNGKIHT